MKKLVIIGIVGMLCCSTGCARENFSKEQAMVKFGYDYIKDMLLEPESLIVYECHGWEQKSENQIKKENKKNKLTDDEVQLDNDQYAVYFYIGARNRMGGITDEEYFFLYDIDGSLVDVITKTEYEQSLEEESDLDYDVVGMVVDAEISRTMNHWENTEDFSDLISSKTFAEIDYQKILSKEKNRKEKVERNPVNMSKENADRLKNNTGELAKELLKTVTSDELTETASDMLPSIYFFEDGAIEEGTAYASSGATACEVAVVQSKDAKNTAEVEKLFRTRVSNQSELYSCYNDSEVARLEEAIIKSAGVYTVLCVTDDVDKANEILEEYGF